MKIGRNEPCYCESGKTYERCCEQKQFSPILTTIDQTSSKRRKVLFSPPSSNSFSSTFITQKSVYNSYDQVLAIFQDTMNKIEELPFTCFIGMTLWERYIEKKQPAIKKVEGYAAALHYVTILYVPSMHAFTQKELAAMYGTTPSFVSNVTNQMKIVLIDNNASTNTIL